MISQFKREKLRSILYFVNRDKIHFEEINFYVCMVSSYENIQKMHKNKILRDEL